IRKRSPSRLDVLVLGTSAACVRTTLDARHRAQRRKQVAAARAPIGHDAAEAVAQQRQAVELELDAGEMSAQNFGKHRSVVERSADVLERHPETAQRPDSIEPLDICFAVQAVIAAGPCRNQQTGALVVMQSADGDTCGLGQLPYPPSAL